MPRVHQNQAVYPRATQPIPANIRTDDDLKRLTSAVKAAGGVVTSAISLNNLYLLTKVNSNVTSIVLQGLMAVGCINLAQKGIDEVRQHIINDANDANDAYNVQIYNVQIEGDENV
jgi:hypothetical protein